MIEELLVLFAVGFGMCGATSKTQTPQQALDALSPRVRYFFEQGSGPNGGRGGCATTSGQPSITVAHQWLRSNATNAGGFSAICMLTAQALLQSLDGVPVGAVESCVSGTNVEPWYISHSPASQDSRWALCASHSPPLSQD